MNTIEYLSILRHQTDPYIPSFNKDIIKATLIVFEFKWQAKLSLNIFLELNSNLELFCYNFAGVLVFLNEGFLC